MVCKIGGEYRINIEKYLKMEEKTGTNEQLNV